jgi:DNA-binding transcriptional regulator YiaG
MTRTATLTELTDTVQPTLHRLALQIAEHRSLSGVDAELREIIWRINSFGMTAGPQRLTAANGNRTPSYADLSMAMDLRNGALRGMKALEDDSWWDALMAVEEMRQTLYSYRETEPLRRPDPELLRWLQQATGLGQPRLADLLGTTTRTFQRWISPSDPSVPVGEARERVDVLATVVSVLSHVLDPAGIAYWLRTPRPDLGGRAPEHLLDDHRNLSELTSAAYRARAAPTS